MIRTISLRYGALCCLLGTLSLGTLAWGQATQSPSAPAMKSSHATLKTAPKATSQTASPSEKDKATTSKVAPEAAVITIPGICNHPAASKAHPATASTCKTMVSRAEFEKVVDAIQPDMPESARRQFAERYAMALTMAGKAHAMGLDHGPEYEEMERLMRLQVLTQILLKDLRDKATVTDKEVEDYYQKNPSAYEEITVERIYIPKAKQPAASTNAADPKARQDNADDATDMKKEADNLHARAVAGEDFTKLQADAFEAAGLKTPPPNTKLTKLRRTSVPPDQSFIFNLKPGETSEVSTNQNGYLFYKLDAKETVPFNTVKDEIHNTLQNQRMQDTMQSIRESTKPVYNDQYFAAAAPAMPGGMAMQRPAAPATLGAGAGQPPRSTPAK